MNLDGGELAALTRMFSAAVLRELGRSGRSSLFSRLLIHSSLMSRMPIESSVGRAFDYAFNELQVVGNRDEYVYRSAITQKILLGRHSLRTASLMSETRVGPSRADMVVLNGTATAYEIKSERDSLARLVSQLSSYSQVFAAVNVVTSATYARDVLRMAHPDVGVLVLSPRFRLQTERAAVVEPSRISQGAVLDMIRVSEALEILRRLGIEAPDVPNTQLRRVLRTIFESLDPAHLHGEMVRTLRISRSQEATTHLVNDLPKSLQAAMLALQLDASTLHRLRDCLNTPLRVALTWS